MRKLFITAIALALGVAWTAAPVLAQQTTTGEKMEKKAEDKAESKTERVKEKARDVKEKVKEKATELKDKTKAKTTELKDKAKAKMDRMEAKAEKKDVEMMQRALKDKGHDPGPVDGIFGPRTRAALTDYQKKEGLTPTGRWDDETTAKLGVRMSSAPAGAATGGAASPAEPRDDKTPATKRENP